MTQIVSNTESDLPAIGDQARTKDMPADADTRRRVRDEAARAAEALERERPLNRQQLEECASGLLRRLALSPSFLGFTMVALNNAFWRDQFAAVPPSGRVLLLPRCLRDPDACRGTYDEVGLTCAACGSCILSQLVTDAETLGYKVVIADGTPAVVQIVLDGDANAVLGVACLDALEKAFRPVSDLGIPHMAVPLLRDGCEDTVAEPEAINEFLYLAGSANGRHTRSFLPLLRAARALFSSEPLTELLDGCTGTMQSTGDDDDADPVAATEAIALEWLLEGGKRFRPFITLSAHAAMTWGDDVLEPNADLSERFPAAVKRIALAIEVLHKASLVHDDLEDDDAYRYGRETLHRRYGPATAINVGDYMIGLGYSLVTTAKPELGAECIADILSHLAGMHLKLCRGQGAEIALTGPSSSSVKTREVQRIYALKTAPAFEAALYAGLRTAVRDDADLPMDRNQLRRYCRFVGVAYQLLNDVKDWTRDDSDKLVVGQDSLAARPTMLNALLLETLNEADRRGLQEFGTADIEAEERIRYVRAQYERMGIFRKADTLAQEYRARALVLADSVQPPVQAELMRFIVETVL